VPNPTVTVSCDAGSSSASPVSIGGACGLVSTEPIGSPSAIRAAAAAHAPSISCTDVTFVVVTSNAANARRSWAGVAMPA
jgi:hypothetical protein